MQTRRPLLTAALLLAALLLLALAGCNAARPTPTDACHCPGAGHRSPDPDADVGPYRHPHRPGYRHPNHPGYRHPNHPGYRHARAVANGPGYRHADETGRYPHAGRHCRIARRSVLHRQGC